MTSVIRIKPSHRGLLHKKLGVPEDQSIPQEKLDDALGSKSPSLRKEANFAENFGGHARGGPIDYSDEAKDHMTAIARHMASRGGC